MCLPGIEEHHVPLVTLITLVDYKKRKRKKRLYSRSREVQGKKSQGKIRSLVPSIKLDDP